MWSSPSFADLELEDVTSRIERDAEPLPSSDWRSKTLRSAPGCQVVDPSVEVAVVAAKPLGRHERLVRFAFALAGL